MRASIDPLVKAVQAQRESKYVDFKESFDVESTRDWVETVKDIVAMANSGGGVILFGVKNNGEPSGFDITSVLAIDPAHITDKVAKYTGEQFAEFSVQEGGRQGKPVAAFLVGSATMPLVFVRPGTYEVAGRKPAVVFSKGDVYFRHGAKSEPCNASDLGSFVERKVDAIRKSWLGNIRKIVQAPVGSQVGLVPTGSGLMEGSPREVRLVDDPRAPVFRRLDPNVTHPHRLKEVLEQVNKRLAGKAKANYYDLQCVRKLHDVDSKRHFLYHPKFGSPRYSELFVDWVTKEFEKDPGLFEKAKKAMKGRPADKGR